MPWSAGLLRAGKRNERSRLVEYLKDSLSHVFLFITQFCFKSGYIRTKRGYFIIEPAADYYPLAGEEHPHLIYQHESERPNKLPSCYVSTNIAKVIAKRATNHTGNNTNTTHSNKTKTHRRELHIEVMVTLDISMLNYHKSIDIENYVLTVFNMVSKK